MEDQSYNDNYWIPVESKRREVKLNLQIFYKNTQSEISERQFDLESFSRGPKGYHLHGFCHKKKRNITLSSLGVLYSRDINDGKLITNIIEHVEDAYRKTKDFKQDSVFDEHGLAIYILVYLSTISRKMTKNKRELLVSFVKSLEGYNDLNDQWIDKTISELYRPNKMEIRNWLKDGVEKKYNLEYLFPWIDKIEEMQKECDPEFYYFRTEIVACNIESKKIT